MHPIHMQLFKKQKMFFHFFCTFLKSKLNFQHIPKKDDTHRSSISKITDFQKRG